MRWDLKEAPSWATQTAYRTIRPTYLPTYRPTTRRGTTWRKGVIKVTMRTLQQPITSCTRSYLFKAEWLLTSTLQGLSRSNLLLASLFQRSHHPPPQEFYQDSTFCHQRKPGLQKSINSCGPPCMSWSRTLKDDMQLVQQYSDTHCWAPWTLFVHLTQVVGKSISQACVTCSNLYFSFHRLISAA